MRFVLAVLLIAACSRPPEAPSDVAPVSPPSALAPSPAQPSSPPLPPSATLADAAASSDSGADSDATCGAQMFPESSPTTLDLQVFEDEKGLFGFRSKNGAVVIAPRFRHAYEFFPEGVTGVVDDRGFAFIDTTGKVIARAFPYDNGPDYFAGGFARILLGGKVGFIDRRGTIVVAPRFDFAASFCEGLAVVCNGCRMKGRGDRAELRGGKWGFVDATGKIVIPMELDSAETFQGGVAEVVKHGEKVRIDRLGRLTNERDGG